jgi:protein tyrosine/serine phosphatase
VDFEGLVNFRDLGGLPVEGGGSVAVGRLFRSDSLAYASPADAKRLVDEYAIATVVDLRGEEEVEMSGRGPLVETSVAYSQVPIADVSPGSGRAEHYVLVLVERAEALVRLLRHLAAPGTLPAVLHCEAGCDRTGVVAALVLGLLGVPDDDICADYARTAAAVPAINARAYRVMQERGTPLDDYPDESWAPQAQTMHEVLDEVRARWGGFAGWADAHGATRADIGALRRALVSVERRRRPGDRSFGSTFQTSGGG